MGKKIRDYPNSQITFDKLVREVSYEPNLKTAYPLITFKTGNRRIYPKAEQLNQAIEDYYSLYGLPQTVKDLPILSKLLEELKRITFYKTLYWLPHKNKNYPRTIEGIVEEVGYEKDGFGISKPFLLIKDSTIKVKWKTPFHSHLISQIERRVLENDEFNAGDKIRITWVGERETNYENPQYRYEIEVIEKSVRSR